MTEISKISDSAIRTTGVFVYQMAAMRQAVDRPDAEQVNLFGQAKLQGRCLVIWNTVDVHHVRNDAWGM